MTVHYPAGMEPFRAVAHLRARWGDVVEIDIKPGARAKDGKAVPPAPLSRTKQLYCASGPHEALVHPDPLFVSEPLVWYAGGRADITADNPAVTLVLMEGSAIRGTGPRPGGLGFGISGWSDARGRLLDLYLVRADAAGTFVVPGVPPGRTLLSNLYFPIRSGAGRSRLGGALPLTRHGGGQGPCCCSAGEGVDGRLRGRGSP